MRNTDWYLRELYDFLPSLNVPIIQADFSRYVIDVNRSLQKPIFGSYQTSAVYNKNTWGEEIYLNKPNLKDIKHRIKQYYLPYHQSLRSLINQALSNYGKVILFDLHSFMGPIEDEVCLGNCFGKSCSNKTLLHVYRSFEQEIDQIAVNNIFSGGYITKLYSKIPQVEVLQIELRYTIYIEKKELELEKIPCYHSQRFTSVKEKLKHIFANIIKQLK